MATAAQPLTDADIARMESSGGHAGPLTDADIAAHEAKTGSPEKPGYWQELYQQSGIPGLIKGIKEHPAETVASAIGGLFAPLNPNYTQSPQGQAMKENLTRSPQSAAAAVTLAGLAAAPGVGRMLPPELGPALKAGAAAAGPDVAIGAGKVAAGSAAAELLPGGPLKYVAGAAPVYSGARQIGRGLSKGAAAFGKTMRGAEEAAPEAAAAAEKTPGQLLAEQDGKTWAKVSKAEKQLYEQIANLKPKFEANAAADQTTASQQAVPTPQPAAEAPLRPAPSAQPSFQPAPAAPERPTEAPAPQTPATPGGGAQTASGEQVQTSGRTFVKDSRPSAEDYTLMEVPTAKIDAGWAKEGPAFYIPPGGGGAEIGGRLPAAKQFIESGQAIEAPRVSMAENGRIAFEDGRHRFAVLRDAGDETTAVMVPHEQVGQFEALSKPSAKPAAGAQTPADIAKAAQAKSKADRFIAAIQRYNIDFPERQPITAAGLEGLGDAEKSTLTRALKSGGYLKNTETFTDTSFPYIVQGLKDAESGSNLAQQLAESIRRARANRASAGR